MDHQKIQEIQKILLTRDVAALRATSLQTLIENYLDEESHNYRPERAIEIWESLEPGELDDLEVEGRRRILRDKTAITVLKKLGRKVEGYYPDQLLITQQWKHCTCVTCVLRTSYEEFGAAQDALSQALDLGDIAASIDAAKVLEGAARRCAHGGGYKGYDDRRGASRDW